MDAGDGQGCFNPRRTAEAQALATWIAGTVVPAAADPDVLIIGDLNSYAKEDPIATLKAAGYRDMIDAAGSKNPYSYVFDGQWGYLDHALASKSLRSQITGAEDVHINADEPRCLTTTSTSRAPGRWPRCTPRIASGPATTTRYWWASRPLADASGAGTSGRTDGPEVPPLC